MVGIKNCQCALEFICLEDITKLHQEMNYVVYNFALPPARRLENFKRFVQEHFNKTLCDADLHATLQYDPASARELIEVIRGYIFKHA